MTNEKLHLPNELVVWILDINEEAAITFHFDICPKSLAYRAPVWNMRTLHKH